MFKYILLGIYLFIYLFIYLSIDCDDYQSTQTPKMN